jgi:hypothetical protein
VRTFPREDEFHWLHTPSGLRRDRGCAPVLINDLGVEPQTRRWHDTLIESEKQFTENFNRW